MPAAQAQLEPRENDQVVEAGALDIVSIKVK
jgi:hypothetical protein